jgi:ABC-type uncharacterized transport system substrate-binding protein
VLSQTIARLDAAGPSSGIGVKKRFLPLKPQFVLSGNVRDLQLCELSVGSVTTLPLPQALGAELRAHGFAQVIGYPLMDAFKIRINTLALGARLPTMHGYREYVEAAGLMSYGANLPDLYRRAGDYVDKILRGAKPGDIPVEQPTKFDFIINTTTARALGLELPPAMLGRANEVIE